LSVSIAKTSIYPSRQRYPGSIAPCDHNAQTSQTDGQRDGHWHRSISARCITSRAKNLQSMNDLDIQVTTKVIKVAAIK